MVTLNSCLIWQILSFILPPNEYNCVYAWKTMENIATDRLTEDADFGKQKKKKNHPFRRSPFWSWRVCKQDNLPHLGHRKATCIHWKLDAPRTSHCLLRIFVQRHNWAIFLRKWARRGRYSQWRSLSRHVERNFVHKNWKGGGYWQHLVSTGRRYVPHSRTSHTRCFAPYTLKIALLAVELLLFVLFVGCRER